MATSLVQQAREMGSRSCAVSGEHRIISRPQSAWFCHIERREISPVGRYDTADCPEKKGSQSRVKIVDGRVELEAGDLSPTETCDGCLVDLSSVDRKPRLCSLTRRLDPETNTQRGGPGRPRMCPHSGAIYPTCLRGAADQMSPEKETFCPTWFAHASTACGASKGHGSSY